MFLSFHLSRLRIREILDEMYRLDPIYRLPEVRIAQFLT